MCSIIAEQFPTLRVQYNQCSMILPKCIFKKSKKYRLFQINTESFRDTRVLSTVPKNLFLRKKISNIYSMIGHRCITLQDDPFEIFWGITHTIKLFHVLIVDMGFILHNTILGCSQSGTHLFLPHPQTNRYTLLFVA